MGDAMNCGACGAACNPGESCVGGTCQCPGTTPARACTEPPEQCCAASSHDGGGCFDVSASHDHCGACGIACMANEECQSGHCVVTSCNPSCGNQNMCVDGQCRCGGSGGCGDPDTCCGAAGCVDTSQDPNHCGNCTTSCSSSSLCCGSGCVPRNAQHCQACDQGCANGATNRATFCCGGSDNGSWQCVTEDFNNCGGCGHSCTMGQTCCGGSCKSESDFSCGPSCNNCNAGGGVCCNHQCCNGICCNGQCKSCIAGLVCACL
jgi:hypothetical protein